MPYTIRKVYKRNCYSVKNAKSKKIRSKCTSKANAKKQVKLLYALENNSRFRPRNTK